MEIEVYDFDKTIYQGDSTLEFYFFCVVRHPSLVRYIPIQLYFLLIYMLGRCSKTKFKEKFYIFLKGIEDIDKDIKLFWSKKKYKINGWYEIKEKRNHVIISASPEFLLKPICYELKVKMLIASKVDKKNGEIIGENCYGKEKLDRLKREIPNYEVIEFYSDSLSDQYLANVSKKSFMVNRGKIINWENYKPSIFNKVKTIFISKTFILFFLIGIINTFNGMFFSFVYSYVFKVNIAFILGYITSMAISYILNSYITFKEGLRMEKYFKFLISYIPNFIIQYSIVIIFYNILGWREIIVYALASAIGVPITFLITKFYTFG